MEIIEIEKTNENFSLIYHVAIATVESGFRPIFKNIFSDGKIIAGTNGTSLHISKYEMKVGLYRVLKCNTRKIILHYEGVDINDFPNIKNIIPDEKILNETNPLNVYIHEKPKRRHAEYNRISKYLNKNNGIDFSLLNKITSDYWKVYQKDENQVISFYDNKLDIAKKMVFIMPLRIKEEE